MNHKNTKSIPEVRELLNQFMKHQLDLAQASLPSEQFKAFRKITLDFFADFERNLRVKNAESGEEKTLYDADGLGDYRKK